MKGIGSNPKTMFDIDRGPHEGEKKGNYRQRYCHHGTLRVILQEKAGYKSIIKNLSWFFSQPCNAIWQHPLSST